MNKVLGRSIRSDGYDKVVAQLSGNWRVILTPKGTRWQLQERVESSTVKSTWLFRGSFTKRSDLIARIRSLLDDNAVDECRALDDLPAQLGCGSNAGP